MTVTASTAERTFNDKFTKIKSFFYEEDGAAPAVAVTIAPGGTPFRLIGIRFNSDANITSSDSLTVSLDANAGAGFDQVIWSKDMSTLASPYEYEIRFDPKHEFAALDELDIAFPNTEANQINIEILIELRY
jgi:hypothetical protein